MSKRTMKASLSGDSFRNLAAEIMEYHDGLMDKCRTLCYEVAQAGYNVINAVLSEHIDTSETIGSLRIIKQETQSVEGATFLAAVRVTSDAIMFLEFGSGLVGAGSATHAEQFGMGSGTYEPKAPRQDPNYDNWENPNGWFYVGNDGNVHKSFGMPASMPMFQGGKEMERKLQEIATRVFA